MEDVEAMLAEAHEASGDGLQRAYIACSTLADSANAGAAVCAMPGVDWSIGRLVDWLSD